jgi:hypothetical protein
MKKLMGLLCDPYLHVIGIGALILFVTSWGGGDGDKKSLAADTNSPCPICKQAHDDQLNCGRLQAVAASPSLATRN